METETSLSDEELAELGRNVLRGSQPPDGDSSRLRPTVEETMALGAAALRAAERRDSGGANQVAMTNEQAWQLINDNAEYLQLMVRLMSHPVVELVVLAELNKNLPNCPELLKTLWADTKRSISSSMVYPRQALPSSTHDFIKEVTDCGLELALYLGCLNGDHPGWSGVPWTSHDSPNFSYELIRAIEFLTWQHHLQLVSKEEFLPHEVRDGTDKAQQLSQSST